MQRNIRKSFDVPFFKIIVGAEKYFIRTSCGGIQWIQFETKTPRDKYMYTFRINGKTIT
jgi:hypothetical protein